MKSKFSKNTEKLKDLTKELIEEAIQDQQKFDNLKQTFSYIGGQISNGNLWQTNQENEALVNINRDVENDKVFSKNTYWEMLRQAQYWQNVFTPKNWDDLDVTTKQAVKLLLTTLFLYGSCALYYDKKNNRLIPYILYGDCKCDVYGQITEGQGIPSGLTYKYGEIVWNNEQPSPNEKIQEKHKEYIVKLTNDNCVFFQWNQWKLGAIVVYTPLVNQLLKAQKRVQNVASLTTLMMEEKCYFGKTSGLDKVILNNEGILHSSIDDKGGKYTPIEDGDNGQKLLAMISYYEWIKGLWYEKVGRRFNVNEKQERNINSEVQYSQLTFSILEKEHLNFLQMGAQAVKEKFNIDIQFTLPTIEDDTFQNQTLQNNNFNKFNDGDK